MRRIFIVVIQNISEFKEYYPVFSRCISTALMISHGLRKDTAIFFYFLVENVIIRIFGEKLRQIRPDEQSLYGIIKKIMRFIESNQLKKRLHTGILASRGNLYEYVKIDRQTYILIEDAKGIDIRQIVFINPSKIIYITSLLNNNTYIFIKFFTKFTKNSNFYNIKTSVQSLFPDSLIVLVNNELDRRFYGRQ